MAHEKNHDYHILNPSIWPFMGAVGAFTLLGGGVLFMHDYGPWVLLAGLALVLYTMFSWWSDVVSEPHVADHTPVVAIGLRYGFIMFIMSEVMFFVAWFWSFFKHAMYPMGPNSPAVDGVWPPAGIETFAPFDLPLINTLILLCSGAAATWAHHALVHENNRKDMKSGLGVVPVLIGLFALPELIKMIVFRPEDNNPAMKLGDNRLTMAEFRGSLKSILRGSVIGVILGAIPGIGPSTAAFFSYSEARRTSKNGDKFGEGELEGIAASESANNGCCGATMIPLLALGVPGDVITGVMLGAFMIHGLTPGPLLFQNNIGEVYSLFIGILFSSVFLFIAGKLTAGAFAKISRIPQTLLLPCILILCVFGIYSIGASPFDVTVLLVMGVVGFIMMILNIPAAPFLIAFILGPMFEDNMRRSIAISRGDLSVFFQSWISWGFFALTILFIALTIRREWQKWREKSRDAAPSA